MSEIDKIVFYEEISRRITALISGETDLITVMSTVVCELHHGINYFHWTGFYRVNAPQILSVGPYQGGHGCLRIPFSQGICGRSATQKATIIIDDVNIQSDHIACATSTISEIVVPVFDDKQNLLAVLDVDSDLPAAFDQIDQRYLEQICAQVMAESWICSCNDAVFKSEIRNPDIR